MLRYSSSRAWPRGRSGCSTVPQRSQRYRSQYWPGWWLVGENASARASTPDPSCSRRSGPAQIRHVEATPTGADYPPVARHYPLRVLLRARDKAVPLSLAAGCYLLALLQRPGLASSDTKIDLHVDPSGFLGDVA